MTLFSFLTPLAALTSLVLLGLLGFAGDLGRREGAGLAVCFVVAGYAQFFGGSMIVAAAGLGLQTLLAIYLIIRWRLAA